MSGTKFVSVDLRDRRDEALEQRLLRHFMAEDCHRPAAANGDVFGEVQRQGRFALRWPRGKNQQFGVLQAAQELVEFGVAGCDSRDAFAFAENSFEAFEIVANDVLDWNESGLHAVFRQRKNG